MKAYVNYFDSDGARARAKLNQDDIRDDEMIVQFNPSPLWKTSRIEAEANRTILTRANIRAKNALHHLCHFEIEKIEPEQFAIFCGDHPPF
jgi:hypothetical protein